MKRFMLVSVLLLFLVAAAFLPYIQQDGSSRVTTTSGGTVVFRPQTADGTSENIWLEVYQKEPLGHTLTLQASTESISSVRMAAGEYYVIAKTSEGRIGSGYIGYTDFVVPERETTTEVSIALRPKSDHSSSVDLTPDIDDIPVPEGYMIVQPIGDPYQIPVMMKEQTTPKVPPKDAHIFTAPPAQSDGYWIYLGGVKLYIRTEVEMNLWHPIALVDSEPGVTHELRLSFLDQQSMTFTSEVEFMGVGISYSYSKTVTFEVSDVTPTTASGGTVITRLGEFKHVYQEGELWFAVYDGFNWWWWYVGDFKREFISDWYTLSHDERNYAYQISETRQVYRGEWRIGVTKDVRITDTTEYSGSVSFEVSKKDVFGASAKIEFTNKHTVEAMHRIVWAPPTPTTYLRLYGGNLFDINMYSYMSGGGGGGCPLLSVYDGQGYVDEGLLDIHNPNGTDIIVEHLLSTVPEAVNGKYLLRLTEESYHFSEIDQVRLLAYLEDGRTISLPLLSAIHSRNGNTKEALLHSDDVRAVIYGQGYDGLETSDYIDLAFASLGRYHDHVVQICFIIEGYNAKTQ